MICTGVKTGFTLVQLSTCVGFNSRRRGFTFVASSPPKIVGTHDSGFQLGNENSALLTPYTH